MNTLRKIRHTIAAYAFFTVLNALLAVGDVLDWLFNEIVGAIALSVLCFLIFLDKHPRLERLFEKPFQWVLKRV